MLCFWLQVDSSQAASKRMSFTTGKNTGSAVGNGCPSGSVTITYPNAYEAEVSFKSLAAIPGATRRSCTLTLPLAAFECGAADYTYTRAIVAIQGTVVSNSTSSNNQGRVSADQMISPNNVKAALVKVLRSEGIAVNASTYDLLAGQCDKQYPIMGGGIQYVMRCNGLVGCAGRQSTPALVVPIKVSENGRDTAMSVTNVKVKLEDFNSGSLPTQPARRGQ
eukprot:jgi/Chrzof1/386/Cz01g13290.t1